MRDLPGRLIEASATQKIIDETVSIVTLKWGDRYGPEFVNRLYAGVQKNLSSSFRFICFTENVSGLHECIETYPLPRLGFPDKLFPSVWLKIGLFADGLADMKGDCIFFDLDMIVVNDIKPFFEFKKGKRCIIHNWKQAHLIFQGRKDVGNSSIFRWRANTTQFIVDQFHDEVDWAITNFRSEQAYLTYAMGEKYWRPETWVRSFKRHAVPNFPLNMALQPTLPRGVKILVFHGKPDPDNAIIGWKGRRWHQRTLPAPWISDYWSDTIRHGDELM